MFGFPAYMLICYACALFLVFCFICFASCVELPGCLVHHWALGRRPECGHGPLAIKYGDLLRGSGRLLHHIWLLSALVRRLYGSLWMGASQDTAPHQHASGGVVSIHCRGTWGCCARITRLIKSLWPSDGIWWHRTGSTLAHVMACCLTATSHYLNQCWFIVSEVQGQANLQEMNY